MAAVHGKTRYISTISRKIGDCEQSNNLPATRQGEIQNQRFGPTVNYFFPDFLSAQNIVRVIEGNIIWN